MINFMGRKKRLTSTLSTDSKVTEQIGIYNAERLCFFFFFTKNPPKHFTVFSLETVNIKILVNLTINTKNDG